MKIYEDFETFWNENEDLHDGNKESAYRIWAAGGRSALRHEAHMIARCDMPDESETLRVFRRMISNAVALRAHEAS